MRLDPDETRAGHAAPRQDRRIRPARLGFDADTRRRRVDDVRRHVVGGGDDEPEVGLLEDRRSADVDVGVVEEPVPVVVEGSSMLRRRPRLPPEPAIEVVPAIRLRSSAQTGLPPLGLVMAVWPL